MFQVTVIFWECFFQVSYMDPLTSSMTVPGCAIGSSSELPFMATWGVSIHKLDSKFYVYLTKYNDNIKLPVAEFVFHGKSFFWEKICLVSPPVPVYYPSTSLGFCCWIFVIAGARLVSLTVPLLVWHPAAAFELREHVVGWVGLRSVGRCGQWQGLCHTRDMKPWKNIRWVQKIEDPNISWCAKYLINYVVLVGIHDYKLMIPQQNNQPSLLFKSSSCPTST